MLTNELLPGQMDDLGGGRTQRRGEVETPRAPTARDVLDIPTFQERPRLKAEEWHSEDTRTALASLSGDWDALDGHRSALVDRLSKRLETPPEDLGISKAGGRLKQELALLRTEIELRGRVDEIRQVMIDEGKEESLRRVNKIIAQRGDTEAAIVAALDSVGVGKHLFDDRLQAYVTFSGPVQEAMRAARQVDSAQTRLKDMTQVPFIRNCEKRIESIRLRLIEMC